MDAGKILVSRAEGNFVIKLEGDVRLTLCAPLNHYIESIFSSNRVESVIVDMLTAKGVDSTTLGLLAKLAIYCNKHLAICPTLFCADAGLLQVIESMGMDDLFDIVEQTPDQLIDIGGFQQLSDPEQDVELIRKHILEAHKLLATLNPANAAHFMDLIASLERGES